MIEYSKAIELALKAHKGQVRKHTETPYIVHPIRVATKVLMETGSIILATAAILHDVVEDSELTYFDIDAMFGKRIADIVEEVTDNTQLKKELGKKAYWLYAWQNMSPQALTIKLYDRLDNIQDRPTVKYVTNTLEVLHQLDTTDFESQPFKAYKALVMECEAFLDTCKK